MALRRASRKFVELNSDEENIDLNKAFLQHRQQYTDQTALQKYGEVIGTLCSALMRMPNVKKIAVSPKYYCCEAKEYSSRYFLGPEPEYIGYAVQRTTKNAVPTPTFAAHPQGGTY